MQACTYANCRLSQWLLRTQTNSLSVGLLSIYTAGNPQCFFQAAVSKLRCINIFFKSPSLSKGIRIKRRVANRSRGERISKNKVDRRTPLTERMTDVDATLEARRKLFEVEVRSISLDRIAMKRSIRSALPYYRCTRRLDLPKRACISIV